MSKKYICMCQDSTGTPHNVEMTRKEHLQDGVCEDCAGNVWVELMNEEEYTWKHKEKVSS